MANRIYKVTTPNGFRLVEAGTRNQAVKHCQTGDYFAEPVSAIDMHKYIQQGVNVEKSAALGKKIPSRNANSETPALPRRDEVAERVTAQDVRNQLSQPQPPVAPPASITVETADRFATAQSVIQEQREINPEAAEAAEAVPAWQPRG